MPASQVEAQWTVILGGIPLSVVADPTRPDAAPGYSGGYATQDSDLTFRKRDVSQPIRSFDRGCGHVEMRGPEDADGYAWAEDMFMWLGNGATPSGRRTATATSFGVANTGAVLDSVLFNGSLHGISSKGGLWWAGTNPASVPTLSPVLNAYGDATSSWRSGYLAKAVVLFQTAAGVPCVVVSTYNSGTGATRMYTYTVAGGWAEGAADLGYRADSMAVVWWEGRDGAGAYRLLISSTTTAVRHCIAGSDPTVGANYVTPIEVADPGYVITKLVSSGGHAFAITTGGIIDFNEIRVWNLTPYWRESGAQTLRSAAMIHDDHIYAARGFGLDRYDLRLDGVQQRISGECAPFAFMQDGSPIRGSVTALAEHEGWLLAAIYNPELKVSYVLRAKDRRSVGVDIKNPLLWHGAEQVLKATDSLITHLKVTPNNAAGTYFTQTAMLWMFTADAYTGIIDPRLYYAPMPAGSGSLSLRLSGGTFIYNSPGTIYHSALTAGDRNATQVVRQLDVVGRDVLGGPSIVLLTRADGRPTTILDPTTWTTQGTIFTDSGSITPTVNPTGHSIAVQTQLVTPNPYTAPPVLHELAVRGAVRRQVFKTRVLWVVLEKDHELPSGARDLRDPDTVFASIVALQTAGYQPFVNEQGGTETVLVEQGYTFSRGEVEGAWRTLCRIDVSTVAP